MGGSHRSAVWRYGLATVGVGIALVVRLAFDPVLGRQSPLLLFTVAIMVLARLLGSGPGLASTLLGGLCGWYFFVDPRNSFAIADPAETVNLALYALVGIGISLLGGQLRRSASLVVRSEERLRLAESSARVSSWEWDIAADRISGSGEFYSQFDITGGQGLRLAEWLDHIHPEDRGRVQQAFGDPAGNVRGLEIEYRVPHQDGRVQWLLGKGAVLPDAKGRPSRALGVNIDITRHKDAELLLRASEELLLTFVQHVPAAVAMLDRGLHYLQASDRWCEDYALVRSAIMGRSHYEVFPDIPERWKEIHRRCLAGEILHAEEDCYERADGTRVWLRWDTRPWGDRGGQPEGMLIFSEDISERKRAAETLGQTEATTRTLLETASQAILAATADGAIHLANQMAARMFGYGNEELVGSPIEMLLPDGLREGHARHRAEFGSMPKSRPMGIGLDLLGRRRDGSEFPIEVSLSQVETGAGPLAVAFVTDITTRKRAEMALRNSERDLRALNRRLLTAQEEERRLIARELHDDVTQKMALLAIDAGRLAAGPLPVEETRTRLRCMQSQIADVSNELRRVSHGLHPAILEDLGLCAALEVFCEEFGRAQGIAVEFDGRVEESGLSAAARSCLYRIGQEGVRNAAKHARATEIGVKVRITAGNMQIEVRDDGVGFSADLLALKKGLGIVSMKERARLVNGTFSITSNPGRGTAVSASVPLGF